MDTNQRIAAAIDAFTAWERPWEFHRAVLHSPLLDDVARSTFERLWLAAAGSSMWRTSGGLSIAGERVLAALQADDPAMPLSALDAVVRAASYDQR